MISSTSNARIRHLKELLVKSRTRNKEGLFVIEGIRLFDEAPVNLISEVYVEESAFMKLKECSKETPLNLSGRVYEKIESLREKGVFVESVSEEVMKKTSETESPQGVIAVVRKPSYSLKDILGDGNDAVKTREMTHVSDVSAVTDTSAATGTSRVIDASGEADENPASDSKRNYLILEDIQDPGNLGTMLRTAEGAGIRGVILSKGCVDIFNPKVVRSTMGSLFRVPFIYVDSLSEAVGSLKENGTTVYAAHLKGRMNYDEVSYTQSSAFLIGNEGNGLKDETASLADQYILIPMGGKLESLNAAVAAAILMYEAR